MREREAGDLNLKGLGFHGHYFVNSSVLFDGKEI